MISTNRSLANLRTSICHGDKLEVPITFVQKVLHGYYLVTPELLKLTPDHGMHGVISQF